MITHYTSRIRANLHESQINWSQKDGYNCSGSTQVSSPQYWSYWTLRSLTVLSVLSSFNTQKLSSRDGIFNRGFIIELDDGKIETGKPDQVDGKNYHGFPVKIFP